MTLDEVCSKLDRVTGFGANRKARCPAHDDNVASLALKEADGGKILLKCHAGCAAKDIATALEITFKDLAGDGAGGEEVARYAYHDRDGKLLYEKVRYEPKDFRFTPSGYRGERVPYNLRAILDPANATRRIVWVEGEKDADALIERGLLATTAGAAGDWRQEMTQYFVGRKVTILPDADGPGLAHARQVASAIATVGEVSICELVGLPAKGDVSDFLKSHTVEDLRREMADRAKPYNERSTDGDLLSTLIERPVDFAWFPRIPKVGLTFIFGEAGIGKSTFAIDILARMSRGDRMPMGAEVSPPKRIIALGFEDDIEGTVVGRFRAARANGDVILIERPAKYPKPYEPLIPGQLEWLRAEVRRHGAEVLFIDNIENSLTGTLESNNSLSIRSALSPLVELAQSMNLAVIALHHPKKGSMFGSAKEAMTGSQAYTNIARSTLEAIEVPSNPDLFALAAVKVNGYPKRIPTLTYRLDEKVTGLRDGMETFEAPTVLWGHETDMTADDLHREHVRVRKLQEKEAAAPTGGRTADAMEFLKSLDLGDGMSWRDIALLGKDQGFSEVSLRRMRPGVLEPAGGWLWRQPTVEKIREEYMSKMSKDEQDEQGTVTPVESVGPATEDRREEFSVAKPCSSPPVAALPTEGARERMAAWVAAEREKHGLTDRGGEV